MPLPVQLIQQMIRSNPELMRDGLFYQPVSVEGGTQARQAYDPNTGMEVGGPQHAWHNASMGWDGVSFAAPNQAGNVQWGEASPGSGWAKMNQASDFLTPSDIAIIGSMAAVPFGVGALTGAAGMAGGTYGGLAGFEAGAAGAGVGGAQASAPGSFWDGATASAGVSDVGSGGWTSFNATPDPSQFGANWGSTVDVTGQLPLNSFPGQSFSMAGLGASLGLGAAGAAAGSGAGSAAGSAAGSFLGGAGNALLGAGIGAGLGMLGGGSKPAGTITTVQDVPEWLKPYITENIDKARGTRDQLLMQNQGALDTSENALSAFARGDSLNANPALGLLQGTASGSYLNSNPYLDAMYAKAARGVTDTYLNTTQPRTDAIFNGPGTMGGNTAYQQMVARNQYGLGENLGNLATSIYGGNYAQERQNQLGAQQSIGNLFSTGQQQQLAAAGALPGVASARTQNAMSPYTQYNSLFPNISQTSQPFFENKIGNLFGGALGGAALGRLFS